jgi:hypothetical protein
MLKSLLLPVVGAVILMSAGCASRPPPQYPVTWNAPAYAPPPAQEPAPGGFGEYAARYYGHQNPPAPGSAPSLGHDLAVAGGAVAGVEGGKYILSKSKTGAAVATGETAAADGVAERAEARAIADGMGGRVAISGGAAIFEEGEVAGGLISILELLFIF